MNEYLEKINRNLSDISGNLLAGVFFIGIMAFASIGSCNNLKKTREILEEKLPPKIEVQQDTTQYQRITDSLYNLINYSKSLDDSIK